MPIKGGASHQTVFNTVNMLVNEKGMTIKQAIVEVEAILRCQLPEDIIARVYQECG